MDMNRDVVFNLKVRLGLTYIFFLLICFLDIVFIFLRCVASLLGSSSPVNATQFDLICMGTLVGTPTNPDSHICVTRAPLLYFIRS